MLEERGTGDTTVVGPHDASTGGSGELLAVSIPRRPTGGVGIDENHGVACLDGRLIGAGFERIQPIHPDEPSV
ncbi:hypothetical protein MMOR_06190 [Mycolicibacterium moriokaense]|uniref:Uncharacterized protein n=1 Tax=Mycolicibacterium moriokaense TaxID=39691 RepID=A0AAD1H6C4_9MYCO|nr:hypothetical protein MMOR_06190 [Mycolicibacterium moriokaense]